MIGKKLTLQDDSGFIAIVNSDKYVSFLDENWELPQLFNHFIAEMNQGNIITWSTGGEGEWSIHFMQEPSSGPAFREFRHYIKVTNEKLFLTNYEDLTMAAQFADEKLPAAHNADLFIELDNGYYEMLIRQMFDPQNQHHDSNSNMHFEVVIRPTVTAVKFAEKVY